MLTRYESIRGSRLSARLPAAGVTDRQAGARLMLLGGVASPGLLQAALALEVGSRSRTGPVDRLHGRCGRGGSGAVLQLGVGDPVAALGQPLEADRRPSRDRHPGQRVGPAVGGRNLVPVLGDVAGARPPTQLPGQAPAGADPRPGPAPPRGSLHLDSQLGPRPGLAVGGLSAVGPAAAPGPALPQPRGGGPDQGSGVQGKGRPGTARPLAVVAFDGPAWAHHPQDLGGNDRLNPPPRTRWKKPAPAATTQQPPRAAQHSWAAPQRRPATSPGRWPGPGSWRGTDAGCRSGGPAPWAPIASPARSRPVSRSCRWCWRSRTGGRPVCRPPRARTGAVPRPCPPWAGHPTSRAPQRSRHLVPVGRARPYASPPTLGVSQPEAAPMSHFRNSLGMVKRRRLA